MAQEQDDEDELEEIVVTGKGFQQSLIDRIPISPQELPFTLNTVDRELLDELNYARPIDALANLPNITIESDLFNLGTPLMLSRGYFAPLLVDSRIENAFRGSGAPDDSFVERYEVLKGPASISLGPVESGGIMNTVTKQPTLDPFAGFELRADQFGTVGAEFDLNAGPVAGNDAVRFRISGAYRDFEYDADPTDRQTIAVRPVVEFDLGSATAVNLSASYTTQDVNPNKGFALFTDGSIPENFDTETFSGLWNGQGESEDTYYSAMLNHEFLDNLKLTVRGSHQVTDLDYTNTTGLYNYNYDDGTPGISFSNPVAYSYSYGGITETENNFVDVQLATFTEWWGERQDFVVGAGYTDNTFYRVFTPFPLIGPVPVTDVDIPRYGNDDVGDYTIVRNDDTRELRSVFAEAAIRPSEKWTILAGVRYDETDSFFLRGGEQKADATSFRLGGSYGLTDDLNAYLSYSESFTPQAGEKRSGEQVGPETSNGWEVGLKGSVFDGTLSFTASVYDTLRDNVAVRDPENVIGEFFVVTVGEQRARGFEFSGDWRPAEGFNLNLNYGHIDIDILEGADLGIVEYSIPENTASAFATYEVQGGALQGLKFGGGVRYNDEKNANVPGVVFDSNTLVDLLASYEINDTYEVALNIINATDELYLESSGTFFGRLTGSSVFGGPRTFAFTLRANF